MTEIHKYGWYQIKFCRNSKRFWYDGVVEMSENERAFWVLMRRALLMMVRAIEARLGVVKHEEVKT